MADPADKGVTGGTAGASAAADPGRPMPQAVTQAASAVVQTATAAVQTAGSAAQAMPAVAAAAGAAVVGAVMQGVAAAAPAPAPSGAATPAAAPVPAPQPGPAAAAPVPTPAPIPAPVVQGAPAPVAAAAAAKPASVTSSVGETFSPLPTRLPDAELVIIELFGGDNNLSSFVYQDLEEMAAGIRGSKIAVLGIADLAGKPGTIVEVTPQHGIQIVEQLGEIDTGDPEVLYRFLVRALITHPAARKAIGFWDHGTGVFDETDNSEKILTRRVNSVARENRSRSHPARRLFFPKSKLEEDFATRGMLHDDTNGGVLTNLEAGAMLGAAFKVAGITQPIDMIFSDTCLNGMIEVLDELAPYAKCIVGSSDLEPGDGWDYKTWLTKVTATRPQTADDWAKTAVDAFRESYEPFPRKYPCTLGAFRTGHKMTSAYASLIEAARKSNPHESFFYLDHARSQAQGFAKKDAYDLRDFATKVSGISKTVKPDLSAAADQLVSAYDAARIHFCTLGKTVTQSTGLAFYFPSGRSQMGRDIETYQKLQFAKNSGWANFLKEFR